MRSVRIVLWGVVAATMVAFAGVTGLQWWESRQPPTAQQLGRAAISGDFSLVDHTGKQVTDENFRGQWLLAFFGFTHCPDVCPTTLNQVALIMDVLGATVDQVQPLFFTVDPERDTPKAMAEYVSVFHPRIIGLTGTPEQVKQAARNYRIYFAKIAQENAPDGYMMDHSAYLYLMNPEGEFETVFSHDDKAEDIAAKIRSRIDRRAG